MSAQLTLLFLECLAILPFLCFHLGAHLANDTKQCMLSVVGVRVA